MQGQCVLDKQEAKAILDEHVSSLRTQSYSELREFVKDSQHVDVTAPSGKSYQVEIQAFWDDKAQQNLLVMTNIDDGGLRAMFPLSDSFIVAPDGSFVGE